MSLDANFCGKNSRSVAHQPTNALTAEVLLAPVKPNQGMWQLQCGPGEQAEERTELATINGYTQHQAKRQTSCMQHLLLLVMVEKY